MGSILSFTENQTDHTQPFNRKAFNAKNNSKNNAYYVPEVQVVVKRYQALLDDQSALDTFVAQQQKIATEIMDVSVTCGPRRSVTSCLQWRCLPLLHFSNRFSLFPLAYMADNYLT